jgi:hypothetical protein
MSSCIFTAYTVQKRRHTHTRTQVYIHVEKVKVNALRNSSGAPLFLYVDTRRISAEGKPPSLPAHLPLFHLYHSVSSFREEEGRVLSQVRSKWIAMAK